MAKELGVSSQEVLDRLDRMGEPASSHSSSIDDGVAERLRSDMSNGDGSSPAGATSPLQRAESGDGSSSGAPDVRSEGNVPGVGAVASSPPGAPPAEKTASATGETAAGPNESSGEKKRFGLFRRKERPTRSRGRRILSQVAELPLLVFVAFIIAVIIKTFLMQAFFIPSGSMKPTLQVGDRVLVEKVTGWFGGPGQGDVVVFARDVFQGKKDPDLPWYRDAQNYVRELLGLPTGSSEDYIKRIVAVGGDTIRYEGSPRQLYVNGEKVKEDYLPKPDNSSSSITAGRCPGKMSPSENGCVVPAGSVFVMGDNRDNSADSRTIGPVEEDKIVGRAFVIIWPPEDFGGL
ncbi:MAG: signal peptidase I [Actinomycetota bacterium]|nr:signal peptidase I [Actinomycetota bacterium]